MRIMTSSKTTAQEKKLCRAALLELSSLLPGPPTPQKLVQLDTPSEPARHFQLNCFPRLLETMLHSSTLDDEEIMSTYIDNGRGEDVVHILTESIRSSLASQRRDRLVSYLCRFVESDAFLFSTLRPSLDVEGDGWQWQEEWLQCVAALPDVLANALQRHLPLQLTPSIYLRSMAVHLAKCVFIVSQALREGSDVKAQPLARFMRQFCAKYDAGYLLDPLLPLMDALTRTDFIARRVWTQLIGSLDDRCLDQLVSHAAHWAVDAEVFQRMVGTQPFPLAERWYRVLCTKPLFLRLDSSDRVGYNVLSYLARDQPTLLKVAKDLLGVWGEKNALLLTSAEQHEFVSRSLITAMVKLEGSVLVDHGRALHDLLRIGVAHHLESAQEKTRVLGMFVAEQCTRRIHPDAAPLTFAYDRSSAHVQRWQKLLEPQQEDQSEKVDFESLLAAIGKDGGGPTLSVDPRPKSRTEVPCVVPVDADVEELDSDDDLEAYDMTEDTVASKWEAPHYIRDAMEMLGSADNDEDAYQRVSLSLSAAGDIIRQQLPLEHPSLATHFLKILMDLQDRFSIANFAVLRMEALVAVCVTHPQPSAQFLTREFYRPNYSIAQRLDMLHAINAASKELSSQPMALQLSGEEVKSSAAYPEEDWRRVVRLRVESKTRRLTTVAARDPLTYRNRFSAVAGDFFFPLAEKMDHCLLFLKLMDEDFVLLSTLLVTLAALVYRTGPVAIVERMVRSLLDMVWLLRLHRQSSVRESALVALVQSLMVTTKDVLLDRYALDLVEWKHWLLAASHKDPSAEVRSLAQQALSLLAHLLN